MNWSLFWAFKTPCEYDMSADIFSVRGTEKLIGNIRHLFESRCRYLESCVCHVVDGLSYGLFVHVGSG